MDSIDISKLPLEVRAKLAELDLEISEGNYELIPVRGHCSLNFFLIQSKLIILPPWYYATLPRS